MDTKEERREHHRFDSLGDIIAINSKNYGQVVNLSMTGLRVKYFMRPSDSFKKSFTISLLNKKGIGKATVKKLIDYFGTFEAIEKASKEEIEKEFTNSILFSNSFIIGPTFLKSFSKSSI